ncbi:hypothetical protein HYDPIDRAFT_27542 [Hydnomerulius pinastri MD-312]|nr:hypothetical protein HYDPIDRAFT_27542 [Hydnomerulius pinastri MD-312]
MQFPGNGQMPVGSDLHSALDTLRLDSDRSSLSPSTLAETVGVASQPSVSPNPWADEQPKLQLKPVSTPDPASIQEATPSIFDTSMTHQRVDSGVDIPRDVLREFDPLVTEAEIDSRRAWADAEGHPPPPRPPSRSGTRAQSRSGSQDLSRGSAGSRPSSPGPQPLAHTPSSSFPSLAAIARSFSIPNVTKPRSRPLSMDTAKPIASPSPTMVASFSAQQQQAAPSNAPSPLSKPLPLQPDNNEKSQSAPNTRSITPSDPVGDSGSDLPRKDKESQFDFQKFLDQMKSKGAEPVAKYLRSFLSNFAKRTFTVNDQVKIINDFLNFIATKMRECEVWRSASDLEFDNAMEGMEKLVMNRLYEFTFTPSLPLLNPPRPVTADDLERDRVLVQRINLFRWVKPSHLDIPELESQDAGTTGFLEFALQELCKVNHYKAPRDKLICILNCCKVIFGLLRHLRKDEGADSFVPVLIFVVLKANPDHLLSNVEFINRFRNPLKLQSEAGYYLSSLMGAVQFIETMDHTSMSNITQEEFERNVETAIQSLPPSLPSSPTSSTSSFTPSIRPSHPSPHAGEESAQPLTLSVPSQAQTQGISEDARRLLQKTGDAVSKPLGAISRIFSEALDEKMAYLPGPFAPFELGRERAQESGNQTERHWAHPDQIAQHRAGPPNTPGGSGDPYQAPIQTPYKPRVRRPSPAPPSPGPGPGPYTNQALALGPSQDVRSMSPSHPPNSLPQHLQPIMQAQHISRTPTPSLDLTAVQAEIDRAHAHASAASRATLAQIFPGVDTEVRDWVLEANGGDLGKSIEGLLEMSGGS